MTTAGYDCEGVAYSTEECMSSTGTDTTTPLMPLSDTRQHPRANEKQDGRAQRHSQCPHYAG